MSAISGCFGSCGTTEEARSAGCRSIYLKYGSSSVDSCIEDTVETGSVKVELVIVERSGE